MRLSPFLFGHLDPNRLVSIFTWLSILLTSLWIHLLTLGASVILSLLQLAVTGDERQGQQEF